MISALLYLQYHSFRNRLGTRLKRLKQPKYLAGAIVGAAYFYFYFIRFLFTGPGRKGAGFSFDPESLALYESVGALVLLVLAFLAWLIPHQRAALTFTEAEVAFLFPAPISRRGLIHYKLLRSQFAIAFTILILTLISNRFGGKAWIHVVGWWVLLSTFNLHSLAASFVRTRLMDRGITTRQRRIGVSALGIAAFASVLWWAHASIPGFEVAGITDVTALREYATQAFTAGPLPYLLYPFRLVVKPYLAADAITFLKAIGPALLIMVLHYWWVVRSDVAFEEDSVEASRRLAEKVAAVRSGNWNAAQANYKPRRPPFPLRPRGPALVALVWKNLICGTQQISGRLLLGICIMVVALLVGMGQMPGRANISAVLGMIFGVLMMWVLILGPQIFRQDLRQDLLMADLLKSYPLPGWQIVLGEILAPVLMLSAVQLGLVALAVIGVSQADRLPITPGILAGSAIGTAILLPMLNLVLFQVPNAAALLFPAWLHAGKEGAQGIEATGQRLIFMLGQMLALFVIVIPAGIAGALAFFLFKFLVGVALAIPLSALAAAIVLAAEAAFGIYWIGRIFERFDLSAELPN